MPEAVLPFDCINIETLTLTARPVQRKQNVDEYWVHDIFADVPAQRSKFTTFPFEFALDDVVMSRPPIKKGQKMVASFAVQLGTPQYDFMKALDGRLKQLMSNTLTNDERDETNWGQIMDMTCDDGNIVVHLPFNSWGQPALPLFKRGSNERLSVHHLTQGQRLRASLSISYLYCIHPAESKNRTGKYQCGAMVTIKNAES